MASSNHVLGEKVHAHLKELKIETPMMRSAPPNATTKDIQDEYNMQAMNGAFIRILGALGMDLADDSIQDTPQRLSKMYLNEICWGLDYSKFPACTTVDNKFNYDELVIVRDIEVKSLCEHHFMPIMGYATIAYIPAKKVLGLSKFNRIVEFFARRPQVQERLTEQVSAALRYILETEDVAVIIRADHLCVKFRGIEDSCSDTVTSKMEGKFRDPSRPGLRNELMTLISHGK